MLAICGACQGLQANNAGNLMFQSSCLLPLSERTFCGIVHVLLSRAPPLAPAALWDRHSRDDVVRVHPKAGRVKTGKLGAYRRLIHCRRTTALTSRHVMRTCM